MAPGVFEEDPGIYLRPGIY